MTLAIAVFGGGGLFATFSYIAPMMTREAGFSSSSITLLLVLFGLGMTAGNLIGARLVDRALMPTLLGGLTLELIVAVVFVAGAHSKVAAAVLICLFPATALVSLPALQSRIITLAGGAPNLAAASVQAAFNIANSLGAYLGGVVIAAGFGYTSPNVIAAGLIAIGIALALLAARSPVGATTADADLTSDDTLVLTG